MEKQRPAALVSSEVQRKVYSAVGKLVGFDLRSSAEVKRAEEEEMMQPAARRKSQALGWASVLKISIVKARDLAVKNTIIGNSDPYVIVTLNNKEFKTQYIPNTLNPVWKETHTCVLSKGDMQANACCARFRL